MLELFDKNGNLKKIVLEEDLNKKYDIITKQISKLPEEKNGGYTFYVTSDITSSGGITIPIYSRGIFICSYNSSDGVLIAVDTSRNLYVGYRNTMSWYLRKI